MTLLKIIGLFFQSTSLVSAIALILSIIHLFKFLKMNSNIEVYKIEKELISKIKLIFLLLIAMSSFATIGIALFRY